MPETVRITDVAPRDGLQNELRPIPADDKVRLVRLLGESGVDEIEVTSFVSPKWIPQLGDAAEVLAALADDKPAGVMYSALVPNEKGMAAALAANAAADRPADQPLIDKISVFTAASETFCQKNTNATFAETLERFAPVVAAARGAGLQVRGYLSCVIACPFEGPIAPQRVAECAAALCTLGIDELDLGDTIGAGDADSTRAMLAAVVVALGESILPRLTLHLHDTFGTAAACVRAALDAGLRSFDGAVGGLGGCPYASTPERRAPGNLATELLVQTVAAAGYKTSVDAGRLAAAGRFALNLRSNLPGKDH